MALALRPPLPTHCELVFRLPTSCCPTTISSESVATWPAASVTVHATRYVPGFPLLTNSGAAIFVSLSRASRLLPASSRTDQRYVYGLTPPSTVAESAAVPFAPPPATIRCRFVVTFMSRFWLTVSRTESATCCPLASVTVQVTR